MRIGRTWVVLGVIGLGSVGACSSEGESDGLGEAGVGDAGAPDGASGDAAADRASLDVAVDMAADATAVDTAPVSSPLTFSPSNVDPRAVGWAGVQDVVIAAACSVNGESGIIQCGSSPITTKFGYARQIQAGAGAVGVFVMKSLRIEPGASLQIAGRLPVVLVAAERIDVLGSIIGSAKKIEAIAGGFSPYERNPAGAGPGGGASGAPGYYGGGGGSFCGLGGAGAADIDDMPAFALAHGGAKYGNADLVPLFGGSSGGGSARDSTGGAGGGAVQLVAGVEIAVGATGVIAVSGGGARPGGGGGSGGAVLIEAPKVTVLGTLAANGGGGGIFAGGAGGQDGTTTTTPAAGETPGTAGNGSAGATLDGVAGISMTSNATSGGGGGAGRFRINSADGQAMLSEKLSPASTTPCVSLGTLKPLSPAGAPLPLPPLPSTIGFKPSNVDLTALIAMPVDDLVFANHCQVDTDLGKIQCGNSQPVTARFAFAKIAQTGAGSVGVVYARSLRIEPGSELEIRGKLPLVIASPGTIAVHGAISGRALGREGWAGGFAAVDTNGTGVGGGAAGAGTYHGGGGGGYCGVGGAGAGDPAAAGGKAGGTVELVPLIGGSSGGGNGGPGGAGGGAVQLISGISIELGLGGLIDVAGGGRAPGSGGGSGGGILLEAPAVALHGHLTANGGGGGVFAGGPGGDDGRSRAEAAQGELPQTAGKGSFGDTRDGQAGLSVTNNATSGGGGGAGRIRINTAAGNATMDGVNSPSAATACFTVGKIQ